MPAEVFFRNFGILIAMLAATAGPPNRVVVRFAASEPRRCATAEIVFVISHTGPQQDASMLRHEVPRMSLSQSSSVADALPRSRREAANAGFGVV